MSEVCFQAKGATDIRLVEQLVEAGRAQAIVGNHELNLLRREQKHGNHWFYGIASDPDFGDCVAIAQDEQEPILEFFRSLPIALERDDLRIVHAAWIGSEIDRCRGIRTPVDVAYKKFDKEFHQSAKFRDLKARHDAEFTRLGPASLLSTSEVFRAFAGSVGFMILSGYFVSAGALTLIFRKRLFSLVRAIWLALLFVAHAIVFLFYLMGPAVPTTSALLIAIGVACVVVVTILENALWRTWI